jgi:hypothetical protein
LSLYNALRYVKERPDQYFGGVAIVYAGDFFQFPPVGGTPLFTPVSSHASQTEQEMLKHLGRLAWKSVNTVITLMEQQRMKTDPKFSAAVQRLCVRQCMYEDLDLFNSRMIRSSSNGQGIDLGSNGNQLAAAIVGTNASQENLNMCKAAANCVLFPDELIVCAANDKLEKLSGTLTREIRQHLLGLNVAAFSSAGLCFIVCGNAGHSVIKKLVH